MTRRHLLDLANELATLTGRDAYRVLQAATQGKGVLSADDIRDALGWLQRVSAFYERDGSLPPDWPPSASKAGGPGVFEDSEEGGWM